MYQQNKSRCGNTGIEHPKPWLNLEQSAELRAKVDEFIDRKIVEWNEKVPFARHLESGEIHRAYYVRHLIETALRIRLLRVAEGKALAEIAKVSPESAQIWAHYEFEEMIHDKLFMDDLQRVGVGPEQVRAVEPYLSTKLLAGFFSYLLDHEGPLGVVAYSYLVEAVNVKIDPGKIAGMKKSLGQEKIQGQVSHAHTDVNDDHPGEVWNVLRYLIRSEDDVRNLYRYLEEHQELLAMYFREIHRDTVEGAKSA